MSRHLLIVGGGVIGLASAYYAAQSGLQVTLLERGPAGRNGCSFGNAGLIVPSHFVPLAAPGMITQALRCLGDPESPFSIQPRLSSDLWRWCYYFWRSASAGHVARSAPLLRDLNLASRGCYEELAQSAQNVFRLEKRGLLMLCKTPHALQEEARLAADARRLGLEAEILDARQTAALDPAIEMEVAGALYFPGDCQLTPQRLMAWLQEEIGRLGVRTCWQTEVTGWRVQGRHINAALTQQGEFGADEYLLCGGSWSPSIARDLRLALPMQAGKGYSLTLPAPRQLPRIAAILTEARVAVTPMGASLRLGGTMELAGLDERINPRRVQGIIHAVTKYYPAFTPADFAGVAPWCGLRPCSPDGLPYLGRTSKYDNLLIASGHAMMGLSLGPITGRLVAEILQGQTTSLDVTLLAPDRFG